MSAALHMVAGMFTFHPWRELGHRFPHVNVEFVNDLPPERLGETDGHSLIRMRKRLLQIDRRCTVVHEMIHMERGHHGHTQGAAERAVIEESARRLIPFDLLEWGVRWTIDPDELADELWVRRDVLEARFTILTGAEVVRIGKVVADAHGRRT